MKKRILVVLFALVLSANLRAQVTIGELVEPTSGAILDLNKAVKGGLALSVVDLPNFYTIPNGFPGIVSQADVTPAVKTGFRGAMVYNTGVTSPPAGIYVWNETNWTPATDNCLPAENLTLSLKASSNAPVLNTPVTFTILSNESARCAGSGTYTWSVLSGTSDVDYKILSKSGTMASIQFITAGAYTVRVEVRNPYSTGSASVETTVLAGGVVPASMKTSGYYLTGKPCYDINKSDTYDSRHVATSAAARVATATDFSVPANRTRTYRFCHENYTNLSVSLLEDNGGLVASISQPASSDQTGTPGCKTFTVTFKSNVESLVNGNGYSVKLLASYRDKNNQARLADMEISVQDGLCGCPAKVSSSGWLTFQCHNLGGLDILTGSETITQAHHGDWYRFGAATASLLNVPATPTGSIPNWTDPPHSDYPFQNDSQNWLTANNPCPAGWRLPTNDNWSALVNASNNSLTNVPGTWGSAGNTQFGNLKKVGDYLYLPVAGYRNRSDGSLGNRGSSGYYWSSSGHNYDGGYAVFSSGSKNVSNVYRAIGFSVRCVAAE
jgi:uncharacterized protein (TIGR02145 family)